MFRSGSCALTAAALTLAVAGCSTDQPTEDSTPDRGQESASSTPGEETEEPAESPGPTPRTGQPLVLVTHATIPPLRLGLRAARHALRGRLSRWQVVAAPGLSAGTAVPRLDSARAVVRAIERDPGKLGVVPAAAVTPGVRRVIVAGVDPIRSPGRYPLTTPGEPPPRPTTLTVVGDLMLTRGVGDPAAALRPFGPRLRSADVTVGNLESTLSRAGAPQQGGDSFGAGPELLVPLQRAGFDALSLANNHTGDYEDQALIDTVRLMRQSRIVPFGAGADLAEASRPAIVERHGLRFGFLGFNAIGETPQAAPGTPGALSVRMPPRTGPLNEADLRHVAGRVRELASRVDVVVVLPHWGTQYTHRPEPVQRLVARRLVDAGADLIVGGHPHWVQGLERFRGTVIAHSLGNFVFDMDFMTETQQGVVLEATYWGAELKAVDLVPYRMDAGFAPRPAVPQEAADILGDVWSTSTGPFASP